MIVDADSATATYRFVHHARDAYVRRRPSWGARLRRTGIATGRHEPPAGIGRRISDSTTAPRSEAESAANVRQLAHSR